jgi:hypothetical protein
MFQCGKMFMWRACNDLLPTRSNLVKRGIIHEAQCPFCEKDEETVEHILWSCPSAQDVWSCGPRKLQKATGMYLTFFHVFGEMLGRCELAELELMAVVARTIWFRRNTVVHGGVFTPPTQVFWDASNSLDAFRRLTDPESTLENPLSVVIHNSMDKTPHRYF